MSFKTSIAGIIAVLAGLGMLGKVLNDFVQGNPVTLEAAGGAITAIGAGAGLIFARDNNVSSEEVGIR